jgi:FHA domain
MLDSQSVEEQLRDWIGQLAPEHKQMLLAMLTEDDGSQHTARLDFALAHLRRLGVERGLNWDTMTDNEREKFLDTLVREGEPYATQFGRSSLALCRQCGREVTPNDLYHIYFGELYQKARRETIARLAVLDMEVETEFPLSGTGEAIIGRIDPRRGILPAIDLSRYDPAARISRRHARITTRSGQFFIEDLGSANGTIINGSKRLKPQEPYPLSNGDVIKIGETTLKFVE